MYLQANLAANTPRKPREEIKTLKINPSEVDREALENEVRRRK